MLLNTKQEEKMPFENGVIYIKLIANYPNLEIIKKIEKQKCSVEQDKAFTKNLKSRDVKGFVQVEHMIKL